MSYGGLGIVLGLGLTFFVAPWLGDPGEARRRLVRVTGAEPWFLVPLLATHAIFVLLASAIGVLFALKLLGVDTRPLELIGVDTKSQMSGWSRLAIFGLTFVFAAIMEWHEQRTKSRTPVKPA